MWGRQAYERIQLTYVCASSGWWRKVGPCETPPWRFGASGSAVRRYVARQQATGSLERTPIPGGPRKISREQDAILLVRLAAEPDTTVLEHCAWWAEHQGQVMSEATMWRDRHTQVQ